MFTKEFFVGLAVVAVVGIGGYILLDKNTKLLA